MLHLENTCSGVPEKYNLKFIVRKTHDAIETETTNEPKRAKIEDGESERVSEIEFTGHTYHYMKYADIKFCNEILEKEPRKCLGCVMVKVVKHSENTSKYNHSERDRERGRARVE